MGLSKQNPRSQAGPGLGGDVPNLRPKTEIRLKLNEIGTLKSLNLSYSVQNYTRKAECANKTEGLVLTKFFKARRVVRN